ncbi:MAG: glycosyltransferase 61 family protein [Pseudomonadota bacterium]
METLLVTPPETVKLTAHSAPHYIFQRTTYEAPRQYVYAIENAVIEFQHRPGNRSSFRISQSLFNHASDARFDEIAFIDDKYTKFNICHFLFDKLTRLMLLKKAGILPKAVLLFSRNKYTHYWINQVLGYTPRYIVRDKGTISTKVLYVVSSSFHLRHPGNFMPADIVDALSALGGSSPAHKALYISREDEATRNVLNEDSIGEIEKVRAQDITPSAQRDLFNECSVLVGPHGAGLANLLFMPRGSTVIEILPPYYGTAAFYIAAERLGHRYVPIVACDPTDGVGASPKEWTHDSTYNRRHMIADPRAVADAVSEALSRSGEAAKRPQITGELDGRTLRGIIAADH